MPWQPIEAAPTDQQPVLGWMPSYYQGKGGMSVILHLHGRWMDNRAWEVKPSHWMPLPAPPSN